MLTSTSFLLLAKLTLPTGLFLTMAKKLLFASTKSLKLLYFAGIAGGGSLFWGGGGCTEGRTARCRWFTTASTACINASFAATGGA
jgi:hypothetical protein